MKAYKEPNPDPSEASIVFKYQREYAQLWIL